MEQKPEKDILGITCMIGFILIIVLGAALIWNSQRLGQERRLRTIEGCATISEPVAKANCYTGDVWD